MNDYENLKQRINKLRESSKSSTVPTSPTTPPQDNFQLFEIDINHVTSDQPIQSPQTQPQPPYPPYPLSSHPASDLPPQTQPQPPYPPYSSHPASPILPPQTQPQPPYHPPYPLSSHPASDLPIQTQPQPPYPPYPLSSHPPASDLPIQTQPQPPYPPYPQSYPPYLSYPQPPFPQLPYHPYHYSYPYQYQQPPYPYQYPYGGYGNGVQPTQNVSEEDLEEELKKEQEKARKLKEAQEKQISNIKLELQKMEISNQDNIDKHRHNSAREIDKKDEYIRKLESAVHDKTRTTTTPTVSKTQSAVHDKTRTTTTPTVPKTQLISNFPTQKREPYHVKSNQDEISKLMALREQNKEKLNRMTTMSNSGVYSTREHQKEISKLQEQKRKLANSGKTAANNVRATLNNVIGDIASLEKGIDLVFLMDCTKSMYPWMKKAKDTIVEIAEKIKTTYSYLVMRIAFVAYRDFHDKFQIEHRDFSNNAEELKYFISTLKAEGGGDIPEDVAGGLHQCLFLSWKSRTRLLIHFADAPPHGRKYHNYHRDSYPHGDPYGNVPEIILEALCMQFKVDYYFAKLNNECDKMLEYFKPIYNRYPDVTMNVIEIGSSVDQFVPLVIKSVSDSVHHTIHH